MASIKSYFRNLLIVLATMILASLSVQTHQPDKRDTIVDDEDSHMFI
jgi:hypothetical protein